MTNHVRTSYRHHRKTTWALATVLVVAVAAVVIPLANAAEKTFTLTAAPTSMCASATNGGASTVLTLKNTGSPQTMGSAEIYFPPNTVYQPSSVLVSTTTTTSGGPKDIIRFNNLGLAPGQSKLFTVSFKANVPVSTPITAVVKQANNFNDSGGGANLFTVQGAFPTLRVVPCVTVSGHVFQDRNLDIDDYTTGSGAFDNSDIPKVWTVKLYAKDTLSAPYPLTATRTTTSGLPDSDEAGLYRFTNVPTGSYYKICVTALGTDDTKRWGLQSPSDNTQCGKLSNVLDAPSPTSGRLLEPLGAEAIDQDFQVVPVIGPFGTSDTSTVGGYTVTAGSNPGQKPDQFYVQDTWVDNQGRTNYRFTPLGTCTQNCSQIYLLETLTADIELSKLEGQQANLRYDDIPPFFDDQLEPMPYCNIDPRPVVGGVPQSSGILATSGVLPGTDTSCIVTGTQSVVAGGNVHAVYQVYTAYDGSRQIG
jgi:hypothetical protein